MSRSHSNGSAPRASGSADHAALRTELLAWYRAEKRDLPWRRTRDPYAIWISEAMLQQTRVETVEGYWTRFIARYPDVAALAAAAEDDVLAAWSGLGYYRRARALRAAARVIVARHGGRFPDRAELVRELPGVGPYTAGAVLSIAFDRPEPIVDGNVARVFGRLFELDWPAESRELVQRLWALARELVPNSGAGDWNQALMELGARICTPKNPRCAVCPVARHCGALAHARVAELPRAKVRRPSIDVELEVLLAARGERVLVERRPARGRMAGLWQLPTVEKRTSSGLFPARHADGARFVVGDSLATVAHTITHHRVRADVRLARWTARATREPFAWFRRSELESLALTGMTRKILRAATSMPC